MMAGGAHPDFYLIYKELAQYHDDAAVRDRVMQELSIEVIRSFLISPAYRSAARGRGKVFVVLEAELMSIPAQNALLKTLEEPPSGVTIILISQRPEQLLPTTLSRCATVRFGLLPREFVMGRLTEAGVGEEEAQFWSAFTAGALGKALRLAQEQMYEGKREILERLAGLESGGEGELGEYLAKRMDSLAQSAVDASKKQDGASLSKTLASRRAAGTILELIASALRDSLKLSTGAELPLVHADQAPAVRRLADRFQASQLAEILEQLGEYERLLWRNVNPKILWDNVAITCVSAASLRL